MTAHPTSKTSRNSPKTSSRLSPPPRPPCRRVCRTSPPSSTDYSKKSFAAGTAMYEKLLGARSVETAIQIQTEFAKQAYEGFVAQATQGFRALHPGRFRRFEAGHHGLREHPEVIIERSSRRQARREKSLRAACRRPSSAGFLLPPNAGALPAPAFLFARSSDQSSRPYGKRNRRGTFRVACDEALARDEQIGNAAIRRRHLAPAARGA